MRALVVTENITVDGVIDATEGWFLPSGAQDAADVAEMVEVERALRADADAVLLGRVTFEQFRGYWPHRVDDATGVSDYLNETQKYVVSSTLTEPGWENTTVLRGPLDEEVAALKGGDGGDIVATGSITLVKALVGTGLVDEYRLFVHPVVLGAGARLFDDAAGRGGLELIEAHPFRSGVTLLRYRPA